MAEDQPPIVVDLLAVPTVFKLNCKSISVLDSIVTAIFNKGIISPDSDVRTWKCQNREFKKRLIH